LHHIKVPGTSLEPGMIIARLTLDDPNKIAQVNINANFKFCFNIDPVCKTLIQ